MEHVGASERVRQPAGGGEDTYNDNPLGLDTPVGEIEIETTPSTAT